MDLNYSTVNIFPVPIHQFDLNGFSEVQDRLIQYAYSLKRIDSGNIISNRGGWQSKKFLLSEETNYLQTFLTNCLANFPYIDKCVDLDVEAWVNINTPDSYNMPHTHPNCDLAGVFWIKCPIDCGDIVFENPCNFQTHNEVDSYTEEFRSKNKYYHDINFEPVEGRMLVFPSHLQHFVEKNESSEDRISTSFNICLEE